MRQRDDDLNICDRREIGILCQTKRLLKVRVCHWSVVKSPLPYRFFLSVPFLLGPT